MNKILLAGILAVFVLCGCKDNSETPPPETEPVSCLPDVADMYVFPITPGSDDWNVLEADELLIACQLPDGVLKSISTEGLIRSFLEVAIIAMEYNDFTGEPYLGWEIDLYTSINSVQELLIRNDASEALLRYCEAIDFNCVGKMGIKEREWFSVRYEALIRLFMRQTILDSLNEADKNKIVDWLIFNYTKIKELNQKGLNDQYSDYVMAVIMHTLLSEQLEEQFSDCDDIIITDEECLPDVADKYIYPDLPAHEHYYLQIPSDVLENISTFGLIRSCLDYPYLAAHWAFQSDLGLDRIKNIYSRRNCNHELIGRSDAGDALLRYYHAISFDCLNPNPYSTHAERLTIQIQISSVAFFLTQQEILDQLDKKKVVALLLSKNGQARIRQSSGYGTVEAMNIAMRNAQYQPVIEHLREDIYADQRIDLIIFAINFIR